MIRLLYIFLLLLNTDILSAQTSKRPFVLHGIINTDSGTVVLIPIGDSSFYPLAAIAKETTVKNGAFRFQGGIAYPCGFRLGLRQHGKWKYISSMFVVEPGVQNITCNLDSIWETPVLVNNSMEELNGKLLLSLESSKNKDEALLYYVLLHPSSYVALWKLVERLDDGYSSYLDSVYTKFDHSLKQSLTARRLETRLSSAKLTTVGAVFPSIRVQDWDLRSMELELQRSTKLTLIDFWFSTCVPCISQFGQLKELYKTYKHTGFDVIGISIDNHRSIARWKNVVKEHSLPWKQYLDLSGTNANRLGVAKYPTNFLLDASGKIIAKDVDLGDLKYLLTENQQ